MQAYRIILADDHTLLRKGIRKLIEERKDLRVVGEAGDGLGVLRMVRTLRPDMVILDLSMPRMSGIEAIPALKGACSNVKILVLTMHKSKEFLRYALAAGAEGYLVKEDADAELFAAIRSIRSGRKYVSPTLSVDLAEDLTRTLPQSSANSESEPLTPREIEVLRLIGEGKTTREIAEQLCISVHTVHHHRDNILRKLQLRKVANLVKYAISKGYASAHS